MGLSQPSVSYRLICVSESEGGSTEGRPHPSPMRACAQLRRLGASAFTPVPKGKVCERRSDRAVAHVSGQIEPEFQPPNGSVWTWFRRSDSCQIARWDLHSWVLPLRNGPGRVVIQQGIAGLRLGMTQAQVKAKVGLPRKVERWKSEIGPSTIYRYRTYSVTFFAGQRVTQLSTVSRKERTAQGIGVGSPIDAVAQVAGVRCTSGVRLQALLRRALGSGRQGHGLRAEQESQIVRISIGYVID